MGDSSADKLVMLAGEGLVSVADIEKWLAALEAKMMRSVCPTAPMVDEWADTIRQARKCLLAMPKIGAFTEAA